MPKSGWMTALAVASVTLSTSPAISDDLVYLVCQTQRPAENGAAFILLDKSHNSAGINFDSIARSYTYSDYGNLIEWQDIDPMLHGMRVFYFAGCEGPRSRFSYWRFRLDKHTLKGDISAVCTDTWYDGSAKADVDYQHDAFYCTVTDRATYSRAYAANQNKF